MAVLLVIEPLRIAAQFALTGAPSRARTLAAGHINDTWFSDTDASQRYVLQRINPHVFADPMAIASNTAAVVAHIRRRAPLLVPPLITARSGAAYVRADSETFRMIGFVVGRTLDRLTSTAQAAAAGAAFGALQRALADYDASQHRVPIEGFHVLAGQLQRFDAALAGPATARHAQAATEIARVQRYRDEVVTIDPGPYGMIHGDGKVTNLIFDTALDEVRGVIDLDTVMWGALSWDLGDLVRSAAALGAEDDPAIGFSEERYAALCEGYLRGAADLAGAQLRHALPLAPGYMTYMLALRFLIDFLSGDEYFRITHPMHNLSRARSQLRLFEAMRDARPAMQRIALRV